jgi:hypothetical protein
MENGQWKMANAQPAARPVDATLTLVDMTAQGC